MFNGALFLTVDIGLWVRVRLTLREHKVRGLLGKQGIAHSPHARTLMKEMRAYVSSVLCFHDSSEKKENGRTRNETFFDFCAVLPGSTLKSGTRLVIKSMQTFVGEQSCGERSCELL